MANASTKEAMESPPAIDPVVLKAAPLSFPAVLDSLAASLANLAVFEAFPAAPIPLFDPVDSGAAVDEAAPVELAALDAAVEDETALEFGLGGATASPSASPSLWLTTAARSSALGMFIWPLQQVEGATSIWRCLYMGFRCRDLHECLLLSNVLLSDGSVLSSSTTTLSDLSGCSNGLVNPLHCPRPSISSVLTLEKYYSRQHQIGKCG